MWLRYMTLFLKQRNCYFCKYGIIQLRIFSLINMKNSVSRFLVLVIPLLLASTPIVYGQNKDPKPADIVIRDKADKGDVQYSVFGDHYISIGRLYFPSEEYLSFDIVLSDESLSDRSESGNRTYDDDLEHRLLDIMQKLDEGAKDSPLHLYFEDGEVLLCQRTNPKWDSLWDFPRTIRFTINSDSFSSSSVRDFKSKKEKTGYLAKCLSTKNIKKIVFEGVTPPPFYQKTSEFLAQAIVSAFPRSVSSTKSAVTKASETVKPVVASNVTDRQVASAFKLSDSRELTLSDLVSKPLGIIENPTESLWDIDPAKVIKFIRENPKWKYSKWSSSYSIDEGYNQTFKGYPLKVSAFEFDTNLVEDSYGYCYYITLAFNDQTKESTFIEIEKLYNTVVQEFGNRGIDLNMKTKAKSRIASEGIIGNTRYLVSLNLPVEIEGLAPDQEYYVTIGCFKQKE